MGSLEITSENFDTEVMQSDKPVLLDFWAPWCGPCKMIGPIIEEIAQETTDIKVGKVNVDSCPELASRFGVMSIPLLAVLKGGEVVDRMAGAAPKDVILDFVASCK